MANIPPFVQTEERAFVRDTRNRALLNTDRAALLRHRAVRTKSSVLAHKVASLEAEVATLKTLVEELLQR